MILHVDYDYIELAGVIQVIVRPECFDRLKKLDENVKSQLVEHKLNLSEIEQDLRNNETLTEDDRDCLKIEAFDIKVEIIKLESLDK